MPTKDASPPMPSVPGDGLPADQAALPVTLSAGPNMAGQPVTLSAGSHVAGQDALPELVDKVPGQPSPADVGIEAALPQVPGYDMLSILGRGGMGVVYLARQVALKRLVALKMILLGDYADREQKQRFRREAEAVARLRHPNIVQIYDIGEHQGQPYFAMEYCDGGTLRTVMKDGPVRPLEAARIIEILARAVDVAHQNLIVHRDLKPDNVLLTGDPGAEHRPPSGDSQTGESGERKPESDGPSEQKGDLELKPDSKDPAQPPRPSSRTNRPPPPATPKITDFGLARKLEADATATLPATLTHPGVVMGTAGYIPPEQAGGERVGPLADVYALGAILYELLTGRAPFVGSVLDVLARVMQCEPEPPRRRRANVPIDIETICMKCLQREQAARYASAEALAEDLRRFQAGETIAARPVGRLERIYKWTRRYPARATVLAMGLLLTMLVGVGAAIVSLWLNAETAKDHERQGRLKIEQAQEELVRSNAQTEEALRWANEEKKKTTAALEREHQAKNALERYLYFDRMLFAWTAWEAGDALRARDLLSKCDKEHRNLEWYHLNHLAAPEIATLAEHQKSVNHIAYSPDGKRLASASDDRTVMLWDAQKGIRLATLTGHKDAVNAVKFSPDGQWLASASEDGTIKLWNARTAKEFKTLQHGDPVRRVVYRPDGQQLASASENGSVKLWEAQTGKELASLVGHKQGVKQLTYSPGGQRLASVSGDGAVKLWDAESGQNILWGKGFAPYAFYVAFSPDGQTLAWASANKTVEVWDLQKNKLVASLPGHKDNVHHLTHSPDGQRLAAVSDDGTIKQWNTRTGQEQATLAGHKKWVYHVAYSPDGQRLASASADGTVKLWHAQTGQQLATLMGHTGPVVAVAYSRDGQRLASASKDGTIKLWDAQAGREVATLAGHTGAVYHATYSPQGQRLASASEDGTIKLWDVHTGKELVTLAGHMGTVYHVAYSPDGKRLASASDDKTVKLWDARTYKELATLEGHKGAVFEVAFSPDGRQLASASYDGMVKLWDVPTGKEVANLAGHTSWVVHTTYSPDGKRLASASGDKTIKLWDVQTAKEVATLKGHKDAVIHLTYSPGGQRLTSASADGTVKLWDAKTGQNLGTLRGHKGPVHFVAYSADGKRLASASADKTVKLWEAATGEPIATLEGHMDGVNHVTFSPDGERLASAGSDGKVKLWDAQTGTEVATLAGHGKAAILVAFMNPSGKQLASAGLDGTVKLWYGELDPAAWSKRKLFLRELQGQRALRDRQWFAAALILEELGEQEPSNASWRAGLGHAHAELQQWDKADLAFASAAALAPKELGPRCDLALVLLAKGEVAKYESLSRVLAAEFGNTKDASSAAAVARLAVLASHAAGDPPAMVQLAAKAVQANPRQGEYRETLGAAHYRAGQFEEALKHLGQAVDIDEENASVWTQLFLAMTHHQLGHKDEAEHWLARANALIKRDNAVVPNRLDWHQQLCQRTLLQEAESLLHAKEQEQ